MCKINVIIRNDASSLIFFGLLARRPVIEVASILALTTSFIAILAEKRIYI
ncbi:hypothetical protein [Algoriphagus aquimarinus]|uniref:hypothetical protein n=1 Tax=Algoriphagus aquimarinus TaxID=237018 RepID=UPI00174E19A0|nr:hypothetical protein [Algoriphagus aquimarinus]